MYIIHNPIFFEKWINLEKQTDWEETPTKACSLDAQILHQIWVKSSSLRWTDQPPKDWTETSAIEQIAFI